MSKANRDMPLAGIAGEVRYVVTREDGSIKEDTGYQRNLILNQGLEFFSGTIGGNFNTLCVIGSGNSTPEVSQVKLDSFIAIVQGTDTETDYSYTDKGDNKYVTWTQNKYRFTGLNDVNISEVGLACKGSSSDYYLTTRALIKDPLGAPTSISVRSGETLDVFYRIYRVVDTRDKSFVVNLVDGDGVTTPYNIVVRPAHVGGSTWQELANPLSTGYKGSIYYSTSDIGSITGSSAGGVLVENSTSLLAYEAGTYKRKMKMDFALNTANADIRSMYTRTPYTLGFTFFPFQIRFGKVSDDSPLTKTNKEIMSIPLEFSWGRYEGEL